MTYQDNEFDIWFGEERGTGDDIEIEDDCDDVDYDVMTDSDED